MLDLPDNPKELVDRSKADVQRELALSNPFLRNSWLGAIITSLALRVYDFYITLRAAVVFVFDPLNLAPTFGVTRLAASKASGNFVATGTATTSIPAGTVITVAGVGLFDTTNSVAISAQTIDVDSITRIGSVATFTTASAHGLANGVEVTITGAAASEYNITGDVTVIADDAFTLDVVGTPADEPATSAEAAYAIATVPVESQEFGAAYNLDAGTNGKLQTPITGVDDALVVDFGAVGNGADAETDEQLRARTSERIQNPIALFNSAAIVAEAKKIAGVTRVFVQEVTPAAGQVTIYFMRDNDTNPIPSASEVTKVKNQILTIKPSHTIDDDVIVLAPTPVSVNFSFSTLTPNTSSMRAAIEANLAQFFAESVTVGTNVDQDAYRAAIFNTTDTETGQQVQTFTLSAPVADITINSGEIAVLGDVNF